MTTSLSRIPRRPAERADNRPTDEQLENGAQMHAEAESGSNSPKGSNTNLTSMERLTHFTWSWFECTMSTGAMAALLSQQAYPFDGVLIIGKIFFILDLVLFALFSACITYRFVHDPRALRLSLHHPHESFFFGTFWVSIALILYNVQQYGTPSCGPWLVKTLEVCFWGYAGCAMLVAIFQYHVIFDEEKLPVHHAMPAWILPVYPFLILGPLGSTLLYSQPQEAALPIFIGSLMFQGLGWMFAFIIYTIYLTRLIGGEMPEGSKRPGMMVAVGPAGKCRINTAQAAH